MTGRRTGENLFFRRERTGGFPRRTYFPQAWNPLLGRPLESIRGGPLLDGPGVVGFSAGPAPSGELDRKTEINPECKPLSSPPSTATYRGPLLVDRSAGLQRIRSPGGFVSSPNEPPGWGTHRWPGLGSARRVGNWTAGSANGLRSGKPRGDGPRAGAIAVVEVRLREGQGVVCAAARYIRPGPGFNCRVASRNSSEPLVEFELSLWFAGVGRSVSGPELAERAGGSAAPGQPDTAQSAP